MVWLEKLRHVARLSVFGAHRSVNPSTLVGSHAVPVWSFGQAIGSTRALHCSRVLRSASSNAQRDPYEVLGVSRGATVDEIKRKYRELAKRHHPDLNPGADAAAKMASISSAYQLLSDPKKREFYDRSGIHPDEAGYDPSSSSGGGASSPFGAGGFAGMDPSGSSFVFTDFTSFFADAFGAAAGGGRAAGHVYKGDDIATEVTLNFVDAAKGCQKKVHLQTNAACDECGGSGCAPGTSLTTCRTCSGTGTQKIERGPIIFGTVCSRCGGSGQVVAQPCRGCKATGVKLQPRAMDLEFPAGVRHGMELRIANQGHCGIRGGRSGDLFVKVNVKPHPNFKLIHDDLHVTVPLTLKECLLGGEAVVPTLDGELRIGITPQTAPGDVKILRGKGMKKLQERGCGDLVVHWSFHMPKRLTKRQIELIQEFDSIENGHSNDKQHQTTPTGATSSESPSSSSSCSSEAGASSNASCNASGKASNAKGARDTNKGSGPSSSTGPDTNNGIHHGANVPQNTSADRGATCVQGLAGSRDIHDTPLSHPPNAESPQSTAEPLPPSSQDNKQRSSMERTPNETTQSRESAESKSSRSSKRSWIHKWSKL